MATRWNGNAGKPLGILEKLRQYFSDAEVCGEAPLFEQLEGRVLLSANPLSEMTDHRDGGQYMNDQVMCMPLTAGVGATPTALADAPAATGPTITGISVSKEAVRTFDPIRFTIGATADAGIARYELTVNGQAVTVYLASGQTGNFTFTEAGTYELVATVTDKAGNVSTHVRALEVAETPDVKAPAVSMSVGNNTSYRQDVPLRVTVSDADSLEINWTAILVDNATGEERVLASGDRAVSGLLLETLAAAGGAMDGSYTLRVEAVDKGGNTTVLARTFTIDTVPPEVEVRHDRAEVGVVTFDILGTDTGGIRARSMTVNGRAVTVNAAGRAEYTFTATGEYTVVARVTDNAGNFTTVSQTIVIGENTDHAGPAVAIVSPAANAHVNGRFDIVATIADAEGEYVGWKVTTVMPGGSTSSTYGTGRVDNKVVRTVYPTGTDGVIRIIIEATDRAGNVTVVERSVTMDTRGPTIAIRYDEILPPGLPVAKPFEVTGSIADAGSPTSLISWKFTITNYETGAVVKEVNGQGNPANGVFAEVNPADYPYGQYWISLEAVDLAGNTTVSKIGRYMDGTPPAYTFTPVLENNVLRVYINGTDNSGRQIYYRLNLISGPEDEWRALGASINSGEPGVMGVTLGHPGVFVYEIYATDWAGNETVPERFTVVYRR